MMKKIVLAILIVFAVNVVHAQANDAFKADVKKFLNISGSKVQAEVAQKQLLRMVPAAKQADFLKEFDASLVPYYETLEKFYMTEFTHDDIRQMIAYYESPVGRKVAQKSGLLNEVTMKALQEWGMNIQGILMKYAQK